MATWNPSDRAAAIAKGNAGGTLTAHERNKLIEASLQAGRFGDDARRALRNAK